MVEFVAEPQRLIISAIVGMVVLLFLIIRSKMQPILAIMISAMIIGISAGMPLTLIVKTIEKGIGSTLSGIALLVGLGSMFGAILEASGGASVIAKTLLVIANLLGR